MLALSSMGVGLSSMGVGLSSMGVGLSSIVNEKKNLNAAERGLAEL